MREPHLLAVEEGPERFAGLLAAVREAGLRAGWLDLPDGRAAAATVGASPGPSEPLPAGLAAAAAAGASRAVAAGGGRTVAVKALRGAPVLRDLLREHFRGCALVLVRGEVAAPHLVLAGDAWELSPPGEAARRYTTAELVLALRRPRPWQS
jgi:hypothetical protein